MSEEEEDKGTKKKKREDAICVVYDKLHQFCINVQMELLVEQAIALSK